MTTLESDTLISHKHNANTTFNLTPFEEALKSNKNLSIPLDSALDILKQLAQFELGKFLLLNKGLNGYWTAYVILHGPQKKNLHPLEEWILLSSPVIKATRERFGIFERLLQSNLKDNTTIASIPCGLMYDLLRLDTKEYKNIQFVGIDYDADSIATAQLNIVDSNAKISFLQKDAWDLQINNQYDIITSNGLNVYEPDDNKVIELYRNFHNALTPNGLLITSFLTPPPILSPDSSWKNFNPEDALKQKVIISEIIGGNWQSFRTQEQTTEQLEAAGFSDIQYHYDSQGMFPTVTAIKSSLY